MAAQYILSFNGASGRVSSGEVIFDIMTKPALSFPFDALYYETPTNNAFRVQANIRTELTPAQITECRAFCDAFATTADYEVHAYDTFDGLYIGPMMRTEAVAKKYGWSHMPPDVFPCFWKDGRWQQVFAILTQEGQLIKQPSSIPGSVGKLLTQAEFSLMPAQPSPVFVWDFVALAWKDPRELVKVKANAAVTVRNIFEGARWRANGKFIPQFEQDTWRIQEAEARAFTANAAAQTPFIDAFLAGRTNPPTKAALAADIIANADAYAKAVAGVNAQQWNWLKRVEVAMTNADVDGIITELQAWDKTQQPASGR